jgi:uncharacterized protein
LIRVASHAALFFVLLVTVGGLAASSGMAEMRREKLTLVTGSGSHEFEVEVTATAEDKAKGLMFRRSLAPNAGMLFPYEPPQEATMWMKNTYISLDMIFIRSDGVVHRIERGTEPFSERTISSNGRVSAVLELNAGTADRIGLSPGDRAAHTLFK